MSPEELLEKLKDSSSQKTCQTLDAIYQICVEQEQRGLNEFSVATIARLGYKRGVPKAQSLRNATGEKYRSLISSFEERNSAKSSCSKDKSEDDWIEEIKNPKHKLLARIQASQLAAANKKVREFVPPGARIEILDYQNDKDGGGALSSLERRALEYIVSDEFLDKWQFAVSEFGEIVDSSGSVVLKAATVDAVKKALKYM